MTLNNSLKFKTLYQCKLKKKKCPALLQMAILTSAVFLLMAFTVQTVHLPADKQEENGPLMSLIKVVETGNGLLIT